MIETSQFQTLVAVANSQSFSKAADDLGVTQSAISQSIKNLEQKVGVRLFRRSGKQVLLTEEGKKLYSLGADFLHRMVNVLDDVAHDKNGMSGKVRIGTLIGIGKSWLAPLMLDLGVKYPDLSLSTVLGFYDNLIEDFRDGKLDLLVLPEYCLPPFGERILLGEEKITLVFPKDDERFEIKKGLTLEKLAAYPTVVFESSAPLYKNWCKKKYRKVAKKVNIKYAINSHGNMLQAVIKGLGVAVVPTHVLNRSIYRDKVGYAGKDFEVSNGKFYLLYHKDGKELLRIRTLIDLIKSSPSQLS